MRIDELETTLRELAAAQPPVEIRRADLGRQRRRRHTRRATAVLLVAGMAVGLVVWNPWRARSNETVVAGPATSVRPDAGLAPDVARCFPTLTDLPDPAPQSPVAVEGAPGDLPDLLLLTSAGEVWVLSGGKASRWTTSGPSGPAASNRLWAQWTVGHTILASRLDASEPTVVIDRFTRPGAAKVASTLPYQVKPAAPPGYCPIDGYLSSFAAGPSSVTVLRHTAGPLPHSCPANPSPSDTDPWRCQSPEATSPAPRGLDLSPEPQKEGKDSFGGFVQVLASGTASDTFALGTGDEVTVVAGADVCCEGGQKTGVVALSPDGKRLAWVSGSTGLRVSDLQHAQDDGQLLWQSADPIEALAWSGTEVAVATKDGLHLVSADDGTDITMTGLAALGPIRAMDFAR